MSYNAVIGHAPTLARLEGMVRRNRVAHAYLFAGPSGVGKKQVALAFAQSLLCARGGCDACIDCTQASARSHPSLRIVTRIDEKREITIEQMRELQRELTLRATDLKPRISIIDEAERLNEEAQNSLLKTLEEPPDRCILILVSSSPALLLPTIVSRCQTILFTPLPEAEMARYGRERLSIDPASLGLLLRLSAGSPGRAAALAPGIAELTSRATDLLATVAAGDLNAIVERLSKIRETEQARDRAREQLMILAFALREIMRARAAGTAPDTAFAPPGLSERLAGLDPDALADRLLSVVDHLRMIDLNANVPLTVEDAMLRI